MFSLNCSLLKIYNKKEFCVMSFLSPLHFSIFYFLVRKSKKVSFAVVVALKTIPFCKHLLLIDVIQTSGIQGAHRAMYIPKAYVSNTSQLPHV